MCVVNERSNGERAWNNGGIRAILIRLWGDQYSCLPFFHYWVYLKLYFN